MKVSHNITLASIVLMTFAVAFCYGVFIFQPIPLRYSQIRQVITDENKVYTPGDLMHLRIEYCAEKYVDQVRIAELLMPLSSGAVIQGREYTVSPVANGNCGDKSQYVLAASVPKVIPNDPQIQTGRYQWEFTATVNGLLGRTFNIRHLSEVFDIVVEEE